MEVPFPEDQSIFNFSHPGELAKELEKNENGSYSQKLTEFVESEKVRLREEFMRDVPIVNRGAYEQIWAASSELIKRSLERFWDHRFEWDDIKREALELEVMKSELEQKFSDFRREMYLFWQTTQCSSSWFAVFQKMMDMHQILKQMALKIVPMLTKDFGGVPLEFQFFKYAATLHMSVEYDRDERIVGDLRKEILQRDLDFIAKSWFEQQKAKKRLRDVLPIAQFIKDSDEWLHDEGHKFQQPLVFDRFQNKPEKVLDRDLLVRPCVEMLLRSMFIPNEFYALRWVQSSEPKPEQDPN